MTTRILRGMFAGAAADEAQASEDVGRRNAKIALFLRSEFFNEEFEPHLDRLIEEWDRAPDGVEVNSAYSTGIRHGVKLVKQYIATLRRGIGGT